jgi:arylsulfatase A-like enzyme
MRIVTFGGSAFWTLALLALWSLPSGGIARGEGSAAQPPNIVLIVSDDQGWRDYGFMGHETIRTAHLDQLSRRSLVFERGYVPAPLCRPSLASLVTGLYPHQHGVYGNDVSPATGLARDREDRPVVEGFYQHPNLIRTLVANGYLAFQSGKWWEGSWREAGFTHGMTHGDATRGGRHGDAGLAIGRAGMGPITQFIDEAAARRKPFFVWYAPFLPHTPHDPPAEILETYRATDRPANVAAYYAMCDWFDQTCGQLLDHFAARSLERDTLVIYLSDNGWAPLDASADNPEDWWNDYAPRSKGSPFETGIRTPIMISWPEHIAPGRVPDLASALDVFPTILHACGIQPPDRLPGINLLDDTARQSRDAVFGASYSIHNMTPGDPVRTLQYRWCIERDWKLLLRHYGSDTTNYRSVHQWDTVPVRLYDLGRDSDEHTNLADDHPDVVQRLTRRIDAEIPASP